MANKDFNVRPPPLSKEARNEYTSLVLLQPLLPPATSLVDMPLRLLYLIYCHLAHRAAVAFFFKRVAGQRKSSISCLFVCLVPPAKEYFKKACERWSEYEIDAPKIMFDLVNKVRQDPQMLVPLLEYEMLRFKGNDLYPTTPAEMESTFGIKHPMPSNSLMYNNSFPHEYIDGKERYAAAIKILRKMKPLPELKWSNFLATSMMDVAYSSAAKPLSNVGSHQTFIAAKRGHDPVRMLIDNIVADQKGTFIKLMFGSESRLGIGCKPSSSHGQKLVLCFADKVRDAEAAEDTAPYNKALLRSYKPANFDPARYLTCEELNRQRNTFLKSEVKNFIEPDLIKKLKASADPNPPKDYIDVDTHVVWKSLDDGRIAGEHKYTYNLPNSKPVTHTAVFYDKPSDLK
eukprot:GHVT01096704.1.p1 GENE.GHVT01096704.1~~GHVT01096704.1.p1  ORF type:complete len:401 (+),score=22.53 GHVT01096704.1:3804-5006(+)